MCTNIRARPKAAAKSSALPKARRSTTPGFTPGCRILSVDGNSLRDVLDWRWYADGEEITVAYVDTDGEAGEVELFRDEGEDWGIEFDGAVFDKIKTCGNACVFCFSAASRRRARFARAAR